MEENEILLKSYIDEITGADARAIAEALAIENSLAKPPQSLGKLEEIAIKFAGVTGRARNRVKKRRLVVFAADNGVVAENVASAPQSVTLMQTINLTRGLTGASVLARHYGAELIVYDVGVCVDVKCDAVRNVKIAYGTQNIRRGAAMTREQAVKAILTGFDAAREAKECGVEILGVGEMGIGNTTTSSAVLSALLSLKASDTCGRGGGVSDEAFETKKHVIDEALEINAPDKNDVIDVIAKLGGFDIAAMTGAYLGCALYRLPVVIDGFIAAVSALCAQRMCRYARDFMFPSHKSKERGYVLAMEEIPLSPILALDMRLGEGSGCPVAFEIIDAALDVISNMATFEQANIDDGYLEGIRGQKF